MEPENFPEHLGGGPSREDKGTWAPEVWNRVMKDLNPGWVVDIGCGAGDAARYFAGYPSVIVFGVDGVKPSNKNGFEFINHDFTAGTIDFPFARFHLGWCCEFVEHIEEQYLPNVLDLFDRCHWLAMTHALPGQLGHHHVNCRDEEYWEEIICRRGFYCDANYSLRLRYLLDGKNHGQYVSNTLKVFRNELWLLK
jgi:SAM-dependent methyltransferase